MKNISTPVLEHDVVDAANLSTKDSIKRKVTMVNSLLYMVIFIQIPQKDEKHLKQAMIIKKH